MRNSIKYFYNIDVNGIRNENNAYFFDNYIFKEINNNFDVNIYSFLIANNIDVYPIIQNKDGNIITNIDNKRYILLRKNQDNMMLNFNIIDDFNIPVNINYDKNWSQLWQKKIDYFEHNINIIKDKNVIECFPYYIGLGELAIRIYNENKYPVTTSLSHYRLNSEVDLMSPDNIIFDYKVRDFAEYIKNNFFNDRLDINKVLFNLSKVNLQTGDYMILYARLLFPTYFFDCIENNGNIKKIISKVNLYENLLKQIYYLFRSKIDIPKIDWLIKKV